MNEIVDIKKVKCSSYVFENIVILKVVAALAVFILHEGQKHESDLIVALMRFAVPMFFFMSAIIYGTRSYDYFGTKFLSKRLKSLSNIYVPYVVCAGVILALVLHFPITQVVWETITDLLFFNGIIPTPIPACGHLWFLTYLLIFYGLLIVVSRLILRKKEYRKVITFSLLVVLFANVTFVHSAKICYLCGYLLLFLNSKFLLDATKQSAFIKTILFIVGIALLSIPVFMPSLEDGNFTGCLAAVLLILGTNYTFITPPLVKNTVKNEYGLLFSSPDRCLGNKFYLAGIGGDYNS